MVCRFDDLPVIGAHQVLNDRFFTIYDSDNQFLVGHQRNYSGLKIQKLVNVVFRVPWLTISCSKIDFQPPNNKFSSSSSRNKRPILPVSVSAAIALAVAVPVTLAPAGAVLPVIAYAIVVGIHEVGATALEAA